MSPIASGDRGGVEQDKEPSQQQAAPAEVPETGTTRMREMVLTRSRTKESHVAGEQLRRSCNAGRQSQPQEQLRNLLELKRAWEQASYFGLGFGAVVALRF
ncbi:hypothetical protein NDU88_000060 [Pleurodeles waltl]|uniref:Uncharacterized protein n=1 Tax=Pleurodeles waltl TaxID=8319 RepID=A0AAV7Q2Q4_PLEWA|nr:hypothetical protein NDU88_000060 [Pleurodeles waltl]